MTTLRPADPAALHARTALLQELYRDCFAGPPWSEPEEQLADFPAQLLRQTSHPGARGLLAHDGAALVGAVYGWPAPAALPRQTAFDQAVADATPPHARALLMAPSLVVAELMVATSHRRRGIAARLLSAYVVDAPAAWLVTHRDGGAPTFYRRCGWQQAAAFTAGGEPMLLFTWARHSPPARAVQQRATQDG
ncbi:GNAT family N-acetyltransferase [Dactylosporangium sp. NPDC050688]|uniref:GNAT family N-acetyltransferase n=1 Tax=Dactylosporangium sp. NPDC050688 TaxID=3157217 RepID=UPI0033C03FAB